jgi:hypothetical protein
MKNGKLRTEEQEIDEMIVTYKKLYERLNDMIDLYCDIRKNTTNPGVPSGNIRMMLFPEPRDVIGTLTRLREHKYGG